MLTRAGFGDSLLSKASNKTMASFPVPPKFEMVKVDPGLSFASNSDSAYPVPSDPADAMVTVFAPSRVPLFTPVALL